jgi:MFS family permease
VLVIYTLSVIPERGVTSGHTLVAASAGLAVLIFFVIFERRTRDPLVPPRLIADPAVAVPNIAIMVQSMVGVAWLFLLTQYLQDERGLSALASGLWFAPMTISSVTAAALAGAVLIRIGLRFGAIVGQLLLVAGVVIIVAAVGSTDGFPAVIIGMVVGEAGFMVSSVAFTVAATSSIEDTQAGLAAGLVNTATQLGGALGLGVVASIAGLAAEPTSGIRLGFLACLVFSGVALVFAVRLRDRARARTDRSRPRPPSRPGRG